MNTPTRIALVSDIHANLHALESVLEDIRVVGADAIACLGDVATLGPSPLEVIDLLRAHAQWFILGNHDEYFLDAELVDHHNEAAPLASAIAWGRECLRHSDKTWIASYERRVELDLGAMRLLLFHGTPESNTVDLHAETPAERLSECLDGYGAEIMAGGHTHLQMLRKHSGRLIVNPGSVGLPFAHRPMGAPPVISPHAEYAIIEVRGRSASVMMRRVELDARRLRAQAARWDQPLARELERHYAVA